MKSILNATLACIISIMCLSSCSDDKTYASLPVYEIGLSQGDGDIHVGDNVILTLTNTNNPSTYRYNSYRWECTPEVDGLQSATPNTNNSFKPLTKGKHTITVKIDASNNADGNASNNGKVIKRGETTNTYTVSTLKTYITVERSIIVR